MKYISKRNTWLVGLVILMITVITILSQDKSSYAQNKRESKKLNYIDKKLEKIVLDGKAPGMIAAIISSDGIIEIGSAGVRKAGSGIAITNNDLVHLGSCTKAMTATMIATLVAEGKLSWDTKLIEAIPELENRIHTDYHKITLWQLLTHRAGIPNDPIDWYAYADEDIKDRRFSILKDNIKLAPAYTDGKFHYSNYGYVVAACMAEQITGLSWETLMRERLFEPLGMTTAGFGDPVKTKSIDQPWGHKRSWIGNKWKPSRKYYGEVISPAGRVHCSVEDWAKFISLQLPGENSILDRKILNKLIEPNGVYAGGWVVFQETEQPWAKGIVLVHGGSNEIWYAAVMVAPAIDRAYVVVTNSCEFGVTDVLCVEMTNKIAKMDLKHRKERMGKSENTKKNYLSGTDLITNRKFIPGSWIGAIKMGDEHPDLVFNLFTDSSGALAGNLSIPGKGIKNLPLSGVKIEQDSIILEIAAAQAGFTGTLTEDELSIEGTWYEGENSYQLRLVPLTEEIDYENVKHENNSSLNLEATSAHFELYSEKKDREVLENLSEILERNYKVITDHMNTEFENKIRVYIYPDLNTFHKAINYPEAPDWVVGAAGRNELKMVSPLNPGSVHSYESLMQAIVHEFAHTVVLNIREHGVVGLPNWLNEGYAYYEADQLTDNQRKLIQSSLLNKTIPSWNDLEEANTAQFGDMGGYGFSATIIEFLVQSYGFDKLRRFFLEPESVESIYGVTEKDLETLWLKYLKNNL